MGRAVRTVNGRTSGMLFFALLPGEYPVRVEVGGAQAREENVAIEEGEISRVEFETP